ncbi:hypothetical protein [Ligilactobacillus salivarius]|uniref:hypothetical protein n=1 Tax=Ligilactobacillus salivarius TaxID=1624 RepID=UPI003F8A4D6A
MTLIQKQFEELRELDPRINEKMIIKSINVVDRNKQSVINYLNGTIEPSPEFLRAWNNIIYPGYKKKVDSYPKIGELYASIDDILKEKGSLYQKILKQARTFDVVLELAMELHEKADYYDMYDILKGNRIMGNTLIYAKSKYIYNEFLKRDKMISDTNFLKIIGMTNDASKEFRDNNYISVDKATPNFDECVVLASKVNHVKPISEDELKEFIQGIDKNVLKHYASSVFHRKDYFDVSLNKTLLKKYYMFYYAYTIRQDN